MSETFYFKEKFREGALSVFPEVCGIEKLCQIEVSQFLECFLSDSTKTLHRGPLCFGYRKNLCIRRGITNFRRKLFVSYYRKISYKAPFRCYLENNNIRKKNKVPTRVSILIQKVPSKNRRKY